MYRKRKSCEGTIIPTERRSGPSGTSTLAAVWPKKLLGESGFGSAEMGGKPGLKHFFQVDLWYDGNGRMDLCLHICGSWFTLKALGAVQGLQDEGRNSPILTTNRDLDLGKPTHLLITPQPPSDLHDIP